LGSSPASLPVRPLKTPFWRSQARVNVRPTIALVMSRSTIRPIVLVLIVLALTVFAGEAVHELHYANDHPGAYGPAKVIALACGAGAVLALAAGIALLLLTPRDGVRLLVLLLLVATAVAVGVWLVTLTTGSSGSAGGGSGFGFSSGF
jgi:hypothetical protein